MKKEKIRLECGCNYQCVYCSEYGRTGNGLPMEELLEAIPI